MKRRIICFLSAAVLIVMTAGCGSGKNAAEESQEETGSVQEEEGQESLEENAAAGEDTEQIKENDADNVQAQSIGNEDVLSGKH